MGSSIQNDNLSQWTVALNGKIWRPSRSSILGQDLLLLEQEINRLRKKPVHLDKSSGKAVAVSTGVPRQVLTVSVAEAPLKSGDRMFAQVIVSFTRDGSDPNFAGVHIWLTGYLGNQTPVLVADAADSPAVFFVEASGEVVTVTVQPFGPTGVKAPFAGAKTTRIALNGVTTAPPAPGIASTTVAITSGTTTVGQQFSFNFLPASLSDIVDGYWIYRGTTNTAPTPPAGRLQYVKNNVMQQGAFVFTDPSGVSTNYYWVSAVNKAGFESSMSAAGTSGGGGGGSTITTYRPSSFTAVSGGGFATPAKVWDGSTSTYSQGYAKASSGVSPTLTEDWQGFSLAGGAITAINLKINVSVTGTSLGTSNGRLQYSLDGGSTWTTVFNTSNSGISQQTYVISLPTNQNLTQVVVQAVSSAGEKNEIIGGKSEPTYGTTTVNVYEIWIEVTT